MVRKEDLTQDHHFRKAVCDCYAKLGIMIIPAKHGDRCLFSNGARSLLIWSASCRAVVQIELSSAYIGYGVGSLGQDADEIHMLVNLLRTEFNATVKFLATH